MQGNRMPYIGKHAFNPIARHRIMLGLNQQDAADAIGVSRVMLNRWEAGKAKPSADNLVKLAKFYNCPIEDLLIREEA